MEKVLLIILCMLSFQNDNRQPMVMGKSGKTVIKINPELLNAKRMSIKNEWIDNMQNILGNLDDSEIQVIVKFIKNNTILAKPLANGVQYLEAGRDKNWIGIVPLLEIDINLNSWKPIIYAETMGHFMPNINALIIKSDNYSKINKALILLHEGYHAYLFKKNPYQQQDDVSFCSEEVVVHSLHNKAMALLGGEKYQQLLEIEAARILKILPPNKDFDPQNIPAIDYPELRKLFACEKSLIDQNALLTAFWINAVYHTIDSIITDKQIAHQKKVIFMCKTYRNAGIKMKI